MRNSTSLTVGNRNVGSIAVDGDRVTASGGELAPALTMPLEMQLLSHPLNETVALVGLTVALSAEVPQGSWLRLGSTVLHWPAGDRGGLLLSSDTSANPYTVTATVDVREPQLLAIQMASETMQSGNVPLRIRMEPTFAWVTWVANELPRPGATERRPAPAAPDWFGLVSDAYPIWNSKAVELTVPVGRERWVEHLLPGLGLDTVRLVAVRLPRASSLPSDDLVARFDAARRYFDLGEYRASIQGLSDLRTAVEDAFGATAADPLPNRIAALRGIEA